MANATAGGEGGTRREGSRYGARSLSRGRPQTASNNLATKAQDLNYEKEKMGKMVSPQNQSDSKKGLFEVEGTQKPNL